jgi:P27 family predicted phage terminase small subunit
LPTHEPWAPLLPETVPPPAGLDAAAAKEWRRLAPLLVRAGLLTELDQDALMLLCDAASQARAAQIQLRRSGLVIKSPNGYPMPSPWLAIERRASATMRALLADFGMSPATRASVTAAAAPPAANPLARFLRRDPPPTPRRRRRQDDDPAAS